MIDSPFRTSCESLVSAKEITNRKKKKKYGLEQKPN